MSVTSSVLTARRTVDAVGDLRPLPLGVASAVIHGHVHVLHCRSREDVGEILGTLPRSAAPAFRCDIFRAAPPPFIPPSCLKSTVNK